MTDERRGTVDLTKPKEDSVNMWQEILREAMSQKELEDANIFIFGDKQTGKKSLMKVLSKDVVMKDTEETKKMLTLDESALKYGMIDYTYLNVRKINEQDSESIGKMGVWIINDIIDKNLLLSLIKPEYILKCICFIVVDLSRPYMIKDSIKKWSSFIYDFFSVLIQKFKLDKQIELRKHIEDHIKLYEEPQFDEEGNYKKETLSEEAKEIKLQLALKEGVLKTNSGVPIGIIVNKTDCVSQQITKRLYEENSDFILKHIRQLALPLGSTIIYASGKMNFNLNVLYDYICYRLFSFDLTHKPNLIDKDMYFIPAGYDSLPALKNSDTQKHLETLYEMKFPSPKSDIDDNDKEETCEDTNVFLAKIKTDKPGLENRLKNRINERRDDSPEKKPENKFQQFLDNKPKDIERDRGDKDTSDKIKESLKDEMKKKVMNSLKRTNNTESSRSSMPINESRTDVPASSGSEQPQRTPEEESELMKTKKKMQEKFKLLKKSGNPSQK